MSKLRQLYTHNANFIPLVTLFIVFRVMALLLARPGGYIFGWNDYYFFKDWASLSNQGLYPFLDFWMEHPPLFSWLGVLTYKFSLFAPPWHDDLLWFSTVFGLALLPFEVGNLVLVYATVSTLFDKPKAITAAWIYSALYLPVFFWTAGFDCYPLFFLLLSVYLAIKSRPALAGLATGVGFMVKIVPGVAGPVILMAMAARAKSKALAYSLATGGIILLISAPFAAANPTMFAASFRNMLSRSSWETIWALLDGYYGSGRGVASPPTRLDPATATITFHGSNLPWTPITIAFVLVVVFLFTRRIDWHQPRKLIAAAALALNLFILYSKGYSPQFVVYPLAFIVILFPNLRGVVYSLLLSAINVAEYPFALVFFDETPWMVATTVILRTFLIMALSAEYLATIFEGHLAKATKLLLPVTASVVVLTLIGLSVAGAGEYSRRQMSSSMFRAPVEFLRAQPRSTVIFADSSSFEQLYPFLRDRHDLLASEGTRSLEKARPSGDIWLVYLGTNKDKTIGPTVERWLAEWAFPLDSTWLSDARLTRYSTASLKIEQAGVNFGNMATLTAYGAEPAIKPGGVLHISLSWKALEKTEKRFKVFIHIVDSQGRIVAQHDTEPAAGLRPTTSWNKGDEILDNHGILLPDDLSPGDYRLLLGLYDSATGTRLTTANGADAYELKSTAIRPDDR